jgi:2-polyprenyl-3-methyl-5-hydroxy-6-metoxy-1,4-benzoquinol methylase
MKCAIITPVGPGHEDSYQLCSTSIDIAVQNSSGPFSSIVKIPIFDLEAKLGRSAARNLGIDKAAEEGCDWIFFLDADDVILDNAFENISSLVDKYDAIWGLICEAPHEKLDQVKVRPNQLKVITSLDQILMADPYLTLQMGHFIRTSIALNNKFDVSLDTGEDFKFYLSVWQKHKCVKGDFLLFVNVRGNHSVGPRSANGRQWRQSVEAQIKQLKAPVVAMLGPNAMLEHNNQENSSTTDLGHILTGRTAVIVAHPDDETLWSGGLLARYKGFDIICCSIPHRDPERILCFFNAVKLLGHYPIVVPFPEKSATTPLEHLHYLNLADYDNIVTHNEDGEYGHHHHIQLNKYITKNFEGNILAFGFGKGSLRVPLDQRERELKLAALKCYDKYSPSDQGKPKWQALLDKYNVDFEVEYYRLILAKKLDRAHSSLSNAEVRIKSDYQHFMVEPGRIASFGPRLQQKMEALSSILPDFSGMKVLDIGCDFGFWSFYAAQMGAKVIGLDRSRDVRGIGRVNIPILNNETALEYNFDAQFLDYEAGRQWFDFSPFDIVLCMSLYHHIFNVCEDHNSIWFWLYRITGGQLIWENPTQAIDVVVKINLPPELCKYYNESLIRAAASKYFDINFEGPAIHEKTREVWRMVPKPAAETIYRAQARDGAGGASTAFKFGSNRRIKEIQTVLGKEMFPGSLNLNLERPFDWDTGYFRSKISDVVDRRKGLDSEWGLRWARFYPLKLKGHEAWAFRFEGERYPTSFVELISPARLRDFIDEGETVDLLKMHP